VPKVPGTEHAIVYSARGSHGCWLVAGKHKYGVAAGRDLIDETDTAALLEAIAATATRDR